MNNLKISTRLTLGFGLLIAMLIAVVGIATYAFNHLGATSQRMIEKDWVKADAANFINATTRANARNTLELLIVTEPTHLAKVRASMAENKLAIDKAFETLDKLIYLPEGRALLNELAQARSLYVSSFKQVSKLVEEGRREEASRIMIAETLPALDSLQKPITGLTQLQNRIVKSSSEEIKSDIEYDSYTMIAIGITGLVAGVLFAILIARSITRPIAQAVHVARTVASGDLSQRITVERKDECGQLLEALRDMNDSLGRTVAQVRQSADTMSTATGEIAAGNLDLSSRTEEQASALEETTASVQEMANTVKQNYESGRHANQLAESASEVAVKGGAVVGKVVVTMEAINESSRKISDIIGVIDAIAFQTNILALNAAVEAARAGDQGRGFAVVASEVRNLAGRSAEAAKQIKSLIESSVGNVSEGCKLVEQAGSTMDEIVVHVRRVADLMKEITNASQDQSSGIEQINQAMQQMDQVTQQNAALVEEAAAAAQSLDQQAQTLVQAVSSFKLVPNQAEDTPVLVKNSAPPNPSHDNWSGEERRGPNRATNVSRLSIKSVTEAAITEPEGLKTGTDDWGRF